MLLSYSYSNAGRNCKFARAMLFFSTSTWVSSASFWQKYIAYEVSFLLVVYNPRFHCRSRKVTSPGNLPNQGLSNAAFSTCALPGEKRSLYGELTTSRLLLCFTCHPQYQVFLLYFMKFSAQPQPRYPSLCPCITPSRNLPF
jgi:hypothetical protein